MALNTTLRYYRGQFDPEKAYQSSNSGNPDVVSMYNPESMNQFIEAVGNRQGRFDSANAALAETKARIGETETYDIKGLSDRLKSFESGINDTVKNKYNGDYGAAANEIARMIGTERSNPWYHFNKQKVEMGKAYLDSKMKIGAGFMSSGNPMDVSFEDWQNGKTFEFTPIDSKDITQKSAAVFQNYSKKLMGDSGLMNSPEGQYFVNLRKYGFQSPEEALDYAEKHGLLDQLYQSMPELAGVKDKEAVMSAIAQGASYGIGTTEKQYLSNQTFGPMLDAQLAGGSGPRRGLTESQYTEAPKNVQNVMDSSYWNFKKDPLAKEVAQKYGIPGINTYDDLVNYRKSGAWSLNRGDEQKMADKALDDIKTKLNTDLQGSPTMFAQKVYNINLLGSIAGKDIREAETQIAAVDTFVNRFLKKPNTIIGIDKGEDKKLEGLTDKTVNGIVFHRTGRIDNPVTIGFQLTGKKKDGTKTTEVTVNTMLDPGNKDDNATLIDFFGQLDDRVIDTYLREFELADPKAFATFITKNPGVAKDYNPENTLNQ
jgi:hypothetical protein